MATKTQKKPSFTVLTDEEVASTTRNELRDLENQIRLALSSPEDNAEQVADLEKRAAAKRDFIALYE